MSRHPNPLAEVASRRAEAARLQTLVRQDIAAKNQAKIDQLKAMCSELVSCAEVLIGWANRYELWRSTHFDDTVFSVWGIRRTGAYNHKYHLHLRPSGRCTLSVIVGPITNSTITVYGDEQVRFWEQLSLLTVEGLYDAVERMAREHHIPMPLD